MGALPHDSLAVGTIVRGQSEMMKSKELKKKSVVKTKSYSFKNCRF